MYIVIYSALFVLIAVFIAIISLIAKSQKQMKATGGIINHDDLMCKFVFKVDLTREEIINILLTKDINDTLFCSFDYDMSKMTFSDLWNDERYYLITKKCDGYTLLRLELLASSYRRSDIKYKLTPFIIDKLKAQAIPYK